MKLFVPVVMILGILSGCAHQGLDLRPKADAEVGQTRPEARPEAVQGDVTAVPEAARTVEEFDTTTAAQRAEAVARAPAAEVALGATIASLGSPSEPGFWLKTPLVTATSKGRVVYPATGKSVQVDLIPIDGPKTAGSRMSLAALRLIEAPLTGLPEVKVYRVGG